MIARRKTEVAEDSSPRDMKDIQDQAILFQALYNELSSAMPNLEELERLMVSATRHGYYFSHAAKMKRSLMACMQCIRFARYQTLAEYLGMTGFVSDVFGMSCADECDRILELVVQRMLRAVPTKLVTLQGK